MNSCQDLLERDGMESRSFPDLLSPLAWFGLWNVPSYSCALCSCGRASTLKRRMGSKLCCFNCLSSGIFGTLGVHFECHVLRRCLFDKVIECIFCIIFNMHNAWHSERVNLCLYTGCKSFSAVTGIFTYFQLLSLWVFYFHAYSVELLMMPFPLHYAHPFSYKF